MDREVLDKWLERGILGLALALLVSMPLLFGGRPQVATGSSLDFLILDPFLVAQWLTLPLLVLWSVRLWMIPKCRLLWPPVCWAVLAFALYAIVRYSTSDIEYVARQELIRILVYAFLFFVFINNLHRQETTQLVGFTLVFLAMAISLYAVYQYLADSDRVWHLMKSYHHRGSGTYICPNHLGGFLEMILPLGLAYTLMGRCKPVMKVFLGYASLAILAGIVVTMSRGTWIATSVALLGFFGVLLFHRTYRLPSLIVLAVVVVAGICVVSNNFTLQARIRQLYSQGKMDDDARFSLWRPALEVWQQNVWFGAGPAHFDYRFREHRPEGVQLRPDRVHNDFLNSLVDWGVVGTAFVASAWALVGFGVLKTWRSVRKTPKDIGGKSTSSKFAFVLGAALGLIAIFVHSVVDFNMHIPANAIVVVVFMALLSSHLRFATDNHWFTARLWTKVLASLVVLAGVAYLGQQGWRHSSENVWLAKAARASRFSPQQVEYYKKAFAAEPKSPGTAYAIAEALRTQSSLGNSDYQDLASQAMNWFQQGMKLNHWDSAAYLGYGWCLDWLDRQEESAPYFDRAEQLDPNGYFTLIKIGLHHVQCGRYAAAKPWFERSVRLQWKDNPTARTYLDIVNRNLMEAASGKTGLVTPISTK